MIESCEVLARSAAEWLGPGTFGTLETLGSLPQTLLNLGTLRSVGTLATIGTLGRLATLESIGVRTKPNERLREI